MKQLHGLQKICKMYGRMKCGDVMMAWDYANDVSVPEKELMADKERWAASERIRYGTKDDQAASISSTAGQ